jgi:tRNA (mo5U34)-methyltransferase
MMNYLNDFSIAIKDTPLEKHQEAFSTAIETRLNSRAFGEWREWESVIQALPDVNTTSYALNEDAITLQCTPDLTEEQKNTLQELLMQLHPWRKGPYQLFDIFINTEWRSDWKWQRIAPHLSDLTNRLVLDVGCGSGYHCWRMRGAGAKLVVGIDPMAKFLFQFEVFKKYMPNESVFLLPLMCEDLPSNMQAFDTVFSMGVLYHRKSPFEHLDELKKSLCSGGELVLETLVIDGDENTVLIPKDRYAQMRNVWFLPSVKDLEKWLKRAGFVNIRTVDIDQTSIEEQRTTDWMTFLSLQDFLDPNDNNKTIEGYPAPKRATLIANKA